MCGIAGFSLSEAADRTALAAMTATLAHRGPDGEGFFVEGGVGLGHRRLSILDIEGGAQPMTNESGSVAVVYNGEIYNYLELRSELQARGHVFKTRSDTEVLVHLYEEEGEAFPARLNGIFAFALYDREGAPCSWPGIPWALSPSTTPTCRAASSSPPNSRPCVPIPRSPASWTWTPSRPT